MPPLPTNATGESAHPHYRCVCGVSFDIRSGGSQTCPTCGRHYDAQVFSSNFADTMTFVGEIAGGTVRPTPSEPDALVGTTREHFRIVARLGEGGMGAVYQAIDESLQRYVALKVIRQPGVARRNLFDQFVQEARAQARVNHPNVVHIYYVGQADDSPFFAMELVPGRTLAERLGDGSLSFAEVVRIGVQVASALEHAARFDIVHGDVKPSNILEADSQTVKISDFGLSRRLSTSSAPDRIAGTPNYLSPECIRGETMDARSDIYSLGVTLFELTFGRLPYELSGPTLQERLDTHLTRSPTFPDPWPESVPEAWRAVLERMLAKNPADRYQDYAELKGDLVRLMPKRRIPAPRAARVIAWVIDAGLVSLLQGIAMAPALIFEGYARADIAAAWRLLATIFGTALWALLLFATIAIQCRWGATPGKRFFRLGIVDAHGLRPHWRTLAMRVPFQFPWLALFFSRMLAASGLDLADNLVSVAVLLLVVINAGFILFRSDQRAVHDRLLRTQVVVDAGDAFA